MATSRFSIPPIPSPPEQLNERLVSIITAVHPERAGHLLETLESLNRQRLPPQWDWEWLLQCDGPESDLLDLGIVPSDSHVRVGGSIHSFGPANARNAALGRARGAYLMNLDADDVLEEDAVLTLLTALLEDPTLAWTCGRTRFWHEDGSVAPYPDAAPLGRVNASWFGDYWLAHDRPPAHPSAFLMKTEIVAACGGWMALAGSEDTGMLAAISEDWDGFAVAQNVLRYRRWNESLTATQAWHDEKPIHYNAIARRLHSMRTIK